MRFYCADCIFAGTKAGSGWSLGAQLLGKFAEIKRGLAATVPRQLPQRYLRRQPC